MSLKTQKNKNKNLATFSLLGITIGPSTQVLANQIKQKHKILIPCKMGSMQV